MLAELGDDVAYKAWLGIDHDPGHSWTFDNADEGFTALVVGWDQSAPAASVAPAGLDFLPGDQMDYVTALIIFAMLR